MPKSAINVETLRDELTKFRVDFAVQELESIDSAVRAAVRHELKHFFEPTGCADSNQQVFEPKESGVESSSAMVRYDSMFPTVRNSVQSLAPPVKTDCLPAGPAESSDFRADARPQEFGWTHRHRKSYLLVKEDDAAETEIRAAKNLSNKSNRRLSQTEHEDPQYVLRDAGSPPTSRRGSGVHTVSPAFSGATASASCLSASSTAGRWQDLKRNSLMDEDGFAVALSHDLEHLTQEAQPAWARHHRKAKRMSTVGQDGFEVTINANEGRIGPYNVSAREKSRYSPFSPLAPLATQTGFVLSGSDSDGTDSALRTAWLAVWAPIRSTVMRGYRLDSCIVVFIIMNAISVGVQTDYMARNWTARTPYVFRVLNLIFCVIFTVEMLLKMCVQGWNFFQTAAWRWNIFDTVVVSGQVIEEVSLSMADIFQPNYVGHDNFMFFSVVRTLRIFRLIRVMRIVSIMHLVGDLRKFVVAITDSMQSLGWTVLLLLLITYIFAVYLTQLVTDHKVRHSQKVKNEQRLLQDYYGSLDRSMLSLYETISDGIHWHEVMDPLKDITPWLSVLFAIYISGIVFALMNVVTGIFVDSAIRAAETDKKRDLVDSMDWTTTAGDSCYFTVLWWAQEGLRCSRVCFAEEFEGQLDNRFMQAYLQAIDLDEEEAVMLFQLLDIDESGEIEADDFVSGCIKLHGGAKAIDLAAFVHEYRRTAKQWNAHFDLVERSLSWLCEQHSKASRRI